MAASRALGKLGGIAGQNAARSGAKRVNPLAMLLGDPSARVPMPDDPANFVPMYGFAADGVGDAYMITTDELFGGKSRASFWVKQYKHFRAGVFEGIVEFASDDFGSRGGFCNSRLRKREPLFEDELVMMETQALQLRVKTDGRPFLINFQCSDTTDEDVWQAEVRTDPFRWETLALPWSGFAHVSRGLVKESQLDLEPHKIDGFGITIADGRNGPFRCELQFVRALKEWSEDAWTPATASVSGSMSEREAWDLEQNEVAGQDGTNNATSQGRSNPSSSAITDEELVAQRQQQRKLAKEAAVSRRASRRTTTTASHIASDTETIPTDHHDQGAARARTTQNKGMFARADAILDGISGPQAGIRDDGRRVNPYSMTDDQRSRWRTARDRRGRQAVREEADSKSRA